MAEVFPAWFAEFRHTFPRIGYGEINRLALQSYHDLVKGQSPVGKIDINDLFVPENVNCRKNPELPDDNRRHFERWTSGLLAGVTAPTKLLAPPLLIQAAGPGAWDIMQRRAAMLIRTEDEFRGKSPESNPQGPPVEGAALAHFINRFQADFLPKLCRESIPIQQNQVDQPKVREETPISCEDRLQVTLVGHSMGTIVIDQLLRYAPTLKVRNIVFMAGATTVEDYRDTIDSYLERNSKTQMYHLILHPIAEVTERGFLDLSPRGSLLIWIDNYFTNPITPLDRTVGRFLNLMPELRLVNTHRDRIHVKIFRIGKRVSCWNPQMHGDFSQFPFWNPKFWNPRVDTKEKTTFTRRDPKCDETRQ